MTEFLKIDIEGAEGAALEGYSNHIRDTYPDMIIELHNPEQDKAVGEFLHFLDTLLIDLTHSPN
ncbi:MAG: FkbM family methyltransferase [Saprospiraceae bacterium]|nr:FkbM family methyltransferase [Saprospiraceae bacterium]